MDEQKGSTFKVVDKRRFSEDGESKDAEAAGNNSANESVSEGRPGQSGRPAEKETAAHRELPPVDFNWFVVSLATQAMVLLGEVPDPLSNQISVSLEGAKQTIDILGMLEEKTKGNLSEEEGRLLEDALANLRLAYVRKLRERQRTAQK